MGHMSLTEFHGRLRRLPLAVLIALHLPLFFMYLRSLWQQTHYQFFPFAIGIFAWLFATRRSKEPENWTWPAKLLILLDVVCIAAGAYLFSPWLFAVGLLATMTAWFMANRDEGYSRRLTYLAVLPLLIVRLPMQYDEQVIHGLQRVTTSVASSMLHRVGMLHYREGNILQFPGKRFLVEEACSGVQSVFTILFIAAVVFCLKRRSLIHGTVLMATGVIFAGIMNSLRVITIAIAWEGYDTDWSTGVSHDVLGYACLAIAAVLLMSADAFLGFLSDAVPDFRRPGAVGMFFNPLIRLWNKTVAVIPDQKPRTTRPQTELRLAIQHDAGSSDSEQREYPEFADLIRPANWFHFTVGWMESWIFSRKYAQLFAGLPFATLTIGSVLLVWWLRHTPIDPVISQLENSFNTAVAAKDISRQETALRALGSLRPSEPQYRFRLAQFMTSQGRINEGLSEILALTPDSVFGYADARMWLVRQALQAEPLKKLSLDDIEKQLKAVLDQQPNHVEAHQLLSQIYVNRNEVKLAERHLSAAAKTNPENNLALAKLMQRLQRSNESIEPVVQQAIETYTKKLGGNRTDAKTRIALAEANIVAGKDLEAREILAAGLQQKDDPLLRKALSDFDLLMIERRLTESNLNRDACTPVVLQALERDPSNIRGVQLISRLHGIGAEVPASAVEQSIEHWQSAVAEKPDAVTERLLLSQLLVCSDQIAEAADALRPAIEFRPELRLNFSKLLLRTGKIDEGAAILETLITEANAKLQVSPDDVAANVQLAEAMIAAGDADKARAHLKQFSKDPSESQIPESPELAFVYGKACLACYDRLAKYSKLSESSWQNSETFDPPHSVEATVLLELLADTFKCPGMANQVIDRLSRLSLSSHASAEGAESMLRQLRLEGTYGSQVLNFLGMHALTMNRYDKAKPWLEQAHLQTRGRDPMVMNNLATAIIRSGNDQQERALQLANDTLKLLPDNPDALSTRGEVYVAMKRWPEALADLTQSLERRQNSADLHRLLEKAYTGMQDSKMAEEHRRRAEALEASTAMTE